MGHEVLPIMYLMIESEVLRMIYSRTI